MNYDEPRKINTGENAGKWHFTSMNDGQIWPIGYCADGCPGHDTEQEARDHQREYVLDNRVQYDRHMAADSQKKCEECGEWTDGLVVVDGWHDHVLCPPHQTREIVAKHADYLGLNSMHS